MLSLNPEPVKVMPVPQPDPTTEADLLTLLSPAVTELCRKHGLSVAGVKADKVARLQALLFPAGGEGGGGRDGGAAAAAAAAVAAIGGAYDDRDPYTQMMSATGNTTVLVGEVAAVFPGASQDEPSVVAGWLFLALKARNGHHGGYVHPNNIESGVHYARRVVEVELRSSD